jgi:hypothetical protein
MFDNLILISNLGDVNHFARVEKNIVMKKTYDREQVESFISIVALAWLSVMCVFVKYDWEKVTSALLNLF